MDFKENILNILEKAKNDIVANIQDAGITASGRTEKSLQVIERDGHLLLIKGEGENAPFETLEIGRPKGAVPKGFNEIILEWIRVKGLSVTIVPYKTNRPHKYSEKERSERMLAGAIAYNIKENGTERSRNNRDDIYTPVLEETVKSISQIAVESVIKTIKQK